MKNLDFSCLVSVLSKDANWMLDVRAASGRVVLPGGREKAQMRGGARW